MTILVTGGAGFIGSNFILKWLQDSQEAVINLDKLTYAGNLKNLTSVKNDPRYFFVKGDILNQELVFNLLIHYQVRAILHFAAESHVDRAISSPEIFIQTNVNGTFKLLEVALKYWQSLSLADQSTFRFIHVSTDEVFGSLTKDEPAFLETYPYRPNSPYSASKAAADHLVRAYYQTYGLPTLSTHCSNNYGPYQFPEKLIPLCIQRALSKEVIPIYGNGLNVRDWLYVDDHCQALQCILQNGAPGEEYNIGGNNEQTNIDVVHMICTLLDKKIPRKDQQSYSVQIKYVQDRLGHDYRYAINANKIYMDLGWKPQESFATGFEKTVDWYLRNQAWIKSVLQKEASAFEFN